MQKRGLSTIIVTLILILVSLVAVGIIWLVVRNIIQTGTEGVGLSQFSLSAKILDVSIDNSSNNVSLTVKRNAGKGELEGISFVFSSNTGTEVITRNVSLKELEQMKFYFHLINVSVSDLISVSIVPLIKQDEKQISGIALDKYNLGSSQGNIQLQACVPTNCSALGYVCGSWNNGTCAGSLNCGSCSGGFSCNASGRCVASCTPATCVGLGYECGNTWSNGTCSGTLDCGTCSSGFSCNSSGRCVANEIYVYALSCSYTDVLNAINSADSGDTVVVPAGSCTWSSTLIINKSITLKGQGKGNTIIKNGIDPDIATWNNYLIDYTPSSIPGDEPFRITEFEIDGNLNGGGIVIRSYAKSLNYLLTKIRIDHNYFHDASRVKDMYSNRCITIGRFSYGVVDHNEFQNCYISISVVGGDQESWDLLPLSPGSSNYLYVEDNTINNTGSIVSSNVIAAGQGGRYVLRYNTVVSMYECQTIDAHGNLGDYPNGNRGTVGTEIYNNNITMGLGSNCGWNQFADIRGGTNIIFNNNLTSKFSVASGNINFQVREEHCVSGGTCSGSWPDGGNYPCYQQVKDTFIWNNKANGDLLTPSVGGVTDCIQLNRDYWTPISGLDANKPGICTSNTYYGATDTGNLYRCYPDNTWNLYYRPYTYPHPLTLVP